MLARRLIRLALRLHPADVRREYGGFMERLLLDDVRSARRRSRVRAAWTFAAGWLDIAVSGVRERGSPSRRKPTRRSQPMDALRMDLRFAFRSLARRPGFTGVAILTLALGIGATTAIFSVVNTVLLRSLPFDEPDRIMRLWSTDVREPGGASSGSVSPVVFEDWQERARSFESMAAWTSTRPTLTGYGDAVVVEGARVTPDFFRVFAAQPTLGRSFTAEEASVSGALSVVVSDGFWRERLGGSRDAVGGTLVLSGRTYEIIGVAPAGFDFPRGARLWLANRNDPQGCGRGCVYMNAVGRLAPGVAVAQARAELDGVGARLAEEYPDALTDRMIGMASLQETTVGDVRPALLILLGAVGMVLLIACANVANLLIARGTSRGDEIAVRVALGAGRRRLVNQLMTESLVLAAAGGGLGVGLAVAGMAAVRQLSPEGIPRIDEIGVDGATLLFTLGLVLLTTVLFGFAPALRLARTSVAGTLREDAIRTVGARRGIGRSALLAAEVGLSLILLVGAGLLLRSFATLQRIDPGFEVDGLAVFGVYQPTVASDPDAAVRFGEELKARLARLPDVDGVTMALGAPLSGSSIWSSIQRMDRPEPPPGQGASAGMRIVDEDFIDVMRLTLTRGRGFDATDRHGSLPVVIINERLAAQEFAGEDPLGKRLDLGVSIGFPESEPRTIVGVFDDLRWEELTGESQPQMLVPQAQVGTASLTYFLRAGAPGAALAAARAEVRSLDPALPLRDPGTMRELFDAQTAAPRFYLFLLAFFAVLAIALAAIGLYGVVAYLVAQRRREIGVRLALGAGTADVIGLVLQQGLVPAGWGAALGLAGAFAGARIMRSLLFGVAPTDPATLAATTVLLLGVVLVACFVPAARATRIPPASALRVER